MRNGSRRGWLQGKTFSRRPLVAGLGRLDGPEVWRPQDRVEGGTGNRASAGDAEFIPQPHLPVVSGGGKALPIGMDGDAPASALVPGVAFGQPPRRGQIPEVNAALAVGGDQIGRAHV